MSSIWTEGAAFARRTGGDGSRALTMLVVTAAAVITAGCFGAQAKTVAVLPLDVPAAPPRIVEVTIPATQPIVLLPEEPAHAPMPVPPPVPAPPARAADPPRTDPAAELPLKPEESARPSSPLQTTATQQELEMERQVRADLARATTSLARVDYRILGPDERTQYDTAKRFIGQAEAAVRARNLVFATNLADKAAALAGQLAGR